MKTVLWAVIALLIAALLFVLTGVMSTGQTDELSVNIAAPIELTWDTYHDASLMPKWIPGFESIVHTSGEAESVGSTYDISLRDESGKLTKMYETVNTFDEYSEFGMDYTNELLVGSTNVSFKATSQDSTVLHVKNFYKGNSWLTNSLLQFFSGTVNKGTAKQYDMLKQLVEDKRKEQLATSANQRMTLPEVDSTGNVALDSLAIDNQ